jgi:curved DNA-binding protein
MQFKDYYQALGVARDASPDDIRRAYRKLARKFHPDVSKEADAEARFKEINEANEVLKDAERRTAYDEAGRDWQRQRERAAAGAASDFQPPPGWQSRGAGGAAGGSPFEGFGGGEHSEFFEALFGRAARGRQAASGPGAGGGMPRMPGQDQHATVTIDLEDSYRGARRSLSMRVPGSDATGQPTVDDRRLEVDIPRGMRAGQHLRLAGQGGPGIGGGPAGDLYLEIAFASHPRFRVDGRDVVFDLPLAPWEAALGATVSTPTPEGPVDLTIPPGSAAGRRLRLKGRGIPGSSAATPAGDLYAVLAVALPPADTDAAKRAWRSFAEAFEFDPRAPR